MNRLFSVCFIAIVLNSSVFGFAEKPNPEIKSTVLDTIPQQTPPPKLDLYYVQTLHQLSYNDQLFLYPYLGAYLFQSDPNGPFLKPLIERLIALKEKEELQILGQFLVTQGRSELEKPYLDLWLILQSIPPSPLKTTFVHEIISQLYSQGHITPLISLAQNTQEIDLLAPTYFYIVKYYLLQHNFPEAAIYLEKIERPSERDSLLTLFTLQLVNTDYLVTIDTMLAKIQSQSALEKALSQLAVAFAEQEKYDLSFKYLHRISGSFELYQQTLGYILVEYAKHGRLDSANQLLTSITDSQLNKNIRSQLTYYYFVFNAYQEGYARAQQTPDRSTLIRISKLLGNRGEFVQFESLLKEIPDTPSSSLQEAFASGYYAVNRVFPDKALGRAPFSTFFKQTIQQQLIQESIANKHYTLALRTLSELPVEATIEPLLLLAEASTPTTNPVFVSAVASAYDAISLSPSLSDELKHQNKLNLVSYYFQNGLIEAGETLLGYLIEDMVATHSSLLPDALKLRLRFGIDDGFLALFSHLSVHQQLSLLSFIPLSKQTEQDLLNRLLSQNPPS